MARKTREMTGARQSEREDGGSRLSRGSRALGATVSTVIVPVPLHL